MHGCRLVFATAACRRQSKGRVFAGAKADERSKMQLYHVNGIDSEAVCNDGSPGARAEQECFLCVYSGSVILAGAGQLLANAHHSDVSSCSTTKSSNAHACSVSSHRDTRRVLHVAISHSRRRSKRRGPVRRRDAWAYTSAGLELCPARAQGRTITAQLRRDTTACGSSAAAGAPPAPTAARGPSPTPSSCPAAPSRCVTVIEVELRKQSQRVLKAAGPIRGVIS